MHKLKGIIKSENRGLIFENECVKLTFAVTLIAWKREVATYYVGFPWSECQVRKLATSHCTKISPPR